MVTAGKRVLVRIAVIGTLVVTPVGVAACGGASHLVGQAIVHKLANTIVRSKSGRKDIDKLFCADNVYAAFKDLRHHHYLWGALTVGQALRNCEAGFKKTAAP